MKAFRSTVTTLILIMLLLVVAAGFVFLFQAELRFRDQLRILSAENEALRADQAGYVLQLGSAEATREAIVTALDTAENNIFLLEGQLAESRQEIDELNAAAATQESSLATAEAWTTPPEVRILSPEDGEILQAGRVVGILIVAADAEGLANLVLRVNGERFTGYEINGETLYSRRIEWTPPSAEGDYTLALTATNSTGLVSDPYEITVTVQDAEARNAETRRRVESNVSDLRGLALLEPVSPVILTRDELYERLAADFATEETAEETRNDVLVLSTFDFMEPDYDLYEAQLELYGDGVLGFYDSETAEFVVVSDGLLLDPLAQLTHAHEFVHALQDQHYDLEALTDESFDSEARAAIRALAEGEAELVQYLYFSGGGYFTQEEREAILAYRQTTDGDDLWDGLPPILIASVSFPYIDGSAFVLDLYREGGFEAIDTAWQNPPRSTEHIMHPDRYRSGDMPRPVTLSSPLAVLGPGWEVIDEDIFGEFFLREYLAQQLPVADAEAAAAGWGGDRYGVFYNRETAELVMALRLVWDSTTDGDEFAAAYPEYARRLYGRDSAVAPGDGSQCWQGEEVVCLFAAAGESFVVRAPDIDTAVLVMAEIR